MLGCPLQLNVTLLYFFETWCRVNPFRSGDLHCFGCLPRPIPQKLIELHFFIFSELRVLIVWLALDLDLLFRLFRVPVINKPLSVLGAGLPEGDYAIISCVSIGEGAEEIL